MMWITLWGLAKRVPWQLWGAMMMCIAGWLSYRHIVVTAYSRGRLDAAAEAAAKIVATTAAEYANRAMAQATADADAAAERIVSSQRAAEITEKYDELAKGFDEYRRAHPVSVLCQLDPGRVQYANQAVGR